MIVVIALVFLMLRLQGVSGGTAAKVTAFRGLAVLAVFQLGVLAFIRWARSRDLGMPTWFLALAAVMENLPMAGAVISNITAGALSPYAALSGTPLLFYAITMAVTTLRLRPWLCILGGVLASGGYAAALAYVTYGLGITTPTTGLPWIFYANMVWLMLITSLACAFVAHEIRGHVEAALAEAESRRERDRMERDLVVASSIQRALLPRNVPNIPGFDIAGWNRPADQTGGDYYDWQRLPDGKWVVTVADVSGHGVGPALVTAACRAYVRASTEHDGDLALLSSKVNRLLADDLPDGRFVTMVSVLIIPGEKHVTLLSAGHGPIALYVSSTGVVRDIMPHDMPLAVESNGEFGPAESIELEVGDVLALVTDGFVEWPRSNGNGQREQFSTSRLRDSLARHAHLPAGAIIEAITRDVTAFTDPTPQQDDLTMVIIRRVS